MGFKDINEDAVYKALSRYMERYVEDHPYLKVEAKYSMGEYGEYCGFKVGFEDKSISSEHICIYLDFYPTFISFRSNPTEYLIQKHIKTIDTKLSRFEASHSNKFRLAKTTVPDKYTDVADALYDKNR